MPQPRLVREALVAPGRVRGGEYGPAATVDDGKPRPRGTGRQGQATSSVAAAQRWRPGPPIMIVPELADRHRRCRTTIPDTSQTAGQPADKHSYQLIEPERGVFILSRPPDQPGSMRRASPDQLLSHKSDCRTNPSKLRRRKI
jgi:hypothetical protein